MKTCTRCNIELNLDNFYAQQQRGKKGQVWQYRDSMCKACRSEYTQTRYRERKAQAVAYLGGACVDCNLETERVEIYDFHHLDPRQKDFSVSNSRKSFEKIKTELDKCVLVCANCHRIRHSSQGSFKECNPK